MAWIGKTESRIFPGYNDLMGSLEEISHVFTVSEGRFFCWNDNYVALMIVESATGFKDDVASGTKLAIPLHKKPYERWMSKEKGKVACQPNWYEAGLVKLLDAQPEMLSKSFNGNFTYSSTQASKDMVGEDETFSWFIKRIQFIPSSDKIVYSASNGDFKSFGRKGYTEAERLQERLNFLHKQLTQVHKLEDKNSALDASLMDVIILMQATDAASGTSEKRTMSDAEYFWAAISLVMGVSPQKPW